VAPVAHSGRIRISSFRVLLGLLRSACSSASGGRTSLAHGGGVGVEALAEQRLRSATMAGKGYEKDDDSGGMGESTSLFSLYPSTVNPSSHLSRLS
jgi:hypothetical protein